MENKKIKVLCLHGWGASPEIMQYQMKNFINYFPEMTFTYLKGYTEIPMSKIPDQRMIEVSPNKKFYAWGDTTYTNITGEMDRSHLFEVFQYLVDHINKEGPFDGILSFSTAGLFNHAFFIALSQGDLKDRLKVSPPKFAFFVNSNYLKSNQQMLTLPTIHIIGEKDILYSTSLMMSTSFVNPLMITVDEGHKFPRLTKIEIEKIRNYIQLALTDGKVTISPKL